MLSEPTSTPPLHERLSGAMYGARAGACELGVQPEIGR